MMQELVNEEAGRIHAENMYPLTTKAAEDALLNEFQVDFGSASNYLKNNSNIFIINQFSKSDTL